MTIKEVCAQFGISADTLRYYERVGAIPEVERTPGGKRDFSADDLKWVQNAICLRNACVPVEMISEYVELFLQGDETFGARLELLKKAKEKVLEARKKYDEALERINYKIEKYEEAVQTGVLSWNMEQKKS
jgi:DNA-binding transcriptional MerR regulator